MNDDDTLNDLKTRCKTLTDRYCVDCKDNEVKFTINILNQCQCIIESFMINKKKKDKLSDRESVDYHVMNQNLCAIVHLMPDLVRKKILEYASLQSDDSTIDNESSTSDYKNNPLWLILSSAAYLKETGDWTILSENVTYKGTDKKSGTVFSHLENAFYYNVKKTELHCELLNQGVADDVIIDIGKNCCRSEYSYKISGKRESQTGESVVWATLFILAGRDFVNILGLLGKKEDAVAAKKYIEVVCRTVDKLYSCTCGAISGFSTGYMENAGILCNNYSWIIMAQTILGQGDKAFNLYKKNVPVFHDEFTEGSENEYYSESKMNAKIDSLCSYEVENSRFTGASDCSFTAISQFILGIRPDFYGLIIDPCIPSEWNEFSVKRMFRGLLYNINVKNPLHVSRGIKSINIDGVAVNGNVIPAFTDGKTHIIEAIIG